MLHGRVPHPGNTLGQVLLSHDAGPPPAPSTRRVAQEDLAAPLDAWFAIALHRDPHFRFQSAHEMAAAFVNLHKTSRASESVPAPEARASFPSLSEVDISERTLPPRLTSGYRIITESPPRAASTAEEPSRNRRSASRRSLDGPACLPPAAARVV